jgi:hypothetical protein
MTGTRRNIEMLPNSDGDRLVLDGNIVRLEKEMSICIQATAKNDDGILEMK